MNAKVEMDIVEDVEITLKPLPFHDVAFRFVMLNGAVEVEVPPADVQKMIARLDDLGFCAKKDDADLLAALEAILPYAASDEKAWQAEAMSAEGGEPADKYLTAIADARTAIQKARGTEVAS